MFERFTDHARHVMATADQTARQGEHPYIGTEHILLGLLKQEDSKAAEIFKHFHVDGSRLCQEIESLGKTRTRPDRDTQARPAQTPGAIKVIENAPGN